MSKLRNPNEDTPLLLAGGGGGHIDGGLLSADRAGQVGWNHRGVVQPQISDNVKTILTILMSKIIQITLAGAPAPSPALTLWC